MDYGKNERCKWHFNTTSDYVLKVTFNDFHLQPDSSCRSDSLEIYDGDGWSANRLGQYCGNILPGVIYSTGKEMVIKFESDGWLEDKGFNISVSAVKAGTVSVLKH